MSLAIIPPRLLPLVLLWRWIDHPFDAYLGTMPSDTHLFSIGSLIFLLVTCREGINTLYIINL